MMTAMHFPYQFDGRGRTAKTDYVGYIQDLIYQVLFTSPGERVMRPGFGCGIKQLVFAPNGAEVAAATQMLVQSSLQEWLGDLIIVNAVEVENNDAILQVTVNYIIRANQEQRVDEFAGGSAV